MAFEFAPLPFNYDDLEPFLSQEALQLHHGDYCKSYADELNLEIRDTRFSQMSLIDIVRQADGVIFLNAAQVWNHEFYWRCLTPDGRGLPRGRLLEAIENSFDTFEGFQSQFKDLVKSNIGAGWTWLIRTACGDLKIINTSSSRTPVVDINSLPLLALDVWEHAYCTDYQHQRGNYVDNFWGVVDWRFVERNFDWVY